MCGCGKTCPEGHPLAAAAIATNWCDECRAVGTSFRCTEGCDHDLCAGCATKPAAVTAAAAAAPAVEITPIGWSAEAGVIEPTAAGLPADHCDPTVDPPPSFPEHWLQLPEVQTEDFRPLPAGFGMGSTTLAEWIQLHLDADATAAAAATAMAAAAAEAEVVRAQAEEEAAAAETARVAADAKLQAEKAEAEAVRPEWRGGLQQMVGLMGFDPEEAAAALNQHNGDVREAVSQLISA